MSAETIFPAARLLAGTARCLPPAYSAVFAEHRPGQSSPIAHPRSIECEVRHASGREASAKNVPAIPGELGWSPSLEHCRRVDEWLIPSVCMRRPEIGCVLACFGHESRRRSPPLVKIVEQQLLSALSTIPDQTDFHVSADVLQSIGLASHDRQSEWLERHRPAHGQRGWRYGQGQWSYLEAATGVQDAQRATVSDWRTTPAMPERKQRRIVVQPLPPLLSRTPVKPRTGS